MTEDEIIDEDDEDQMNVCARCGTPIVPEPGTEYYCVEISKTRHTKVDEVENLNAVEIMEICTTCAEAEDALVWLEKALPIYLYEHGKDLKGGLLDTSEEGVVTFDEALVPKDGENGGIEP